MLTKKTTYYYYYYLCCINLIISRMTTFIPVPIHLPEHPLGSLPLGLILVGLLVALWAFGIYKLFK